MNGIHQCIQQMGSRTNARFDCPSCGGENTLSISRIGREIKYYCFRSVCKLKGINNASLSPDALKAILMPVLAEERPFELPTYWIKGITSEKCLKTLLNTHSYSAYRNGLFSVAYDPKQNRICYLLKDKGNIVGAVGRTLAGGKPKTLNYPGSAKIPFKVGTSDTVVCVEDCASACAVTRGDYTGLALLGTSLKDDYIPYITEYKKIIIALDKDARDKALEIRNRLMYYHNDVTVWFLDKDIKDMTDDEFKEFICK